MIFVTVGTHDAPFERLVRAAESLGAALEEEVVLQRGYTTTEAPSCTVYDLVGPDRMRQFVAAARLVITHGGPASILMAEAAGKVPIVVPRRAVFGEHVDDHQVHFARRIRTRICLVECPADLPQVIQAPPEVSGYDKAAGKERSREFGAALGTLCKHLVSERRARVSLVRATVSALLQRTV